jgi:hypothetical protein
VLNNLKAYTEVGMFKRTQKFCSYGNERGSGYGRKHVMTTVDKALPQSAMVLGLKLIELHPIQIPDQSINKYLTTYHLNICE